MNPVLPQAAYEEQLLRHNNSLQRLQKKRKTFGWIRLLSILFPLILAFTLLPAHLLAFLLGLLIIIIIFLKVVSLDIDNDELIAYYERLIAINEEELKVLQFDYSDRYDGKEWEPHVHAYAADLDLFGPYSLYQYINRCDSMQGKQLLAERLKEPLSLEDAKQWQDAVLELQPQLEWRQEFQCFGRIAGFSFNTEERIMGWLSDQSPYISKNLWKKILLVFPVFPIAATVLFSLDKISLPFFLLLLLVFFVFSQIHRKWVNALHGYVSRVVQEINSLQLQIQHIERKKFQSSQLIRLQKGIQSDTKKASGELSSLKRILQRFDYRLNMLVGTILNIFLLWDIRQSLQLEDWKSRNHLLVKKWIDTMAMMEVLNTLSIFAFNHPKFSYPIFAEEYFHFEATGLGHPLINPGKRVTNDCKIEGIGQVMLITGSNMAGKSTFLRSLGVNTILALTGAPVCAERLILSPVHLISSMRIADNLAENTSTFYAELKKLQLIIEKVNQHEQIFILLDEILRGTNSFDRHTGSKAFLQQLVQEKAVAVVATHDIELASMERDYPSAIHNFHFDVQVENEELYFDYRLKTGICKSMNASILMKKIGIRV